MVDGEEKRDELYVKKIRNGTVIDHVSAGLALDVLKILNITGRDGRVVSIAMNVPSRKYGKKDIIKVEDRELRPEEVDKIALIAPKSTINIIRDYKVHEKKRVKLPEVIRGIIRCGNPSCITNSREPVEPTFKIEATEPLSLRCTYCGRTMEQESILSQF
ncbi:MAG: aspartate carbamoyltransferase regulatory subunit [Candidatus Bathyarchaeia archaeon]|nr:aspartate carbamoyltransferase regulatory subunit [Candidatus Bathyarchaeota archaeon]